MNAIDTNVWLYCYDDRDPRKRERARELALSGRCGDSLKEALARRLLARTCQARSVLCRSRRSLPRHISVHTPGTGTG